MKAPPLPLTSARLIYRLNQLDDLEFLLDIHSRPDVVRFLPWGVLDEASLRAKINERMQEKTLIEDGDKLNFICLDKESGVRVGEVGLFMRSKDHQGGEVGYVMHPDHAGKGYATEAAKAMLALGFDFFGLNRIMARCDQRNLPSEGVMKAIGMRHEATLIENWRDDDGSWSNELNYAILKREWGAQNPG